MKSREANIAEGTFEANHGAHNVLHFLDCQERMKTEFSMYLGGADEGVVHIGYVAGNAMIIFVR